MNPYTSPATVPKHLLFAPGKEPPPIKDRPLCPGCNKRLRPFIEGSRYAAERGREALAWNGIYDSYGAFCKLRCAASFANAAYKAGYRLKFAGAVQPATAGQRAGAPALVGATSAASRTTEK